MRNFDPVEIKKLFVPNGDSKNGQVTIIGGSSLFHGAPLLSLTVASKIVDMVFFSCPEPSVGEAAANLKSKLFSFIWVPWDEIDDYIIKSDAILLGSGFMRYRTEKNENTNPNDEDETAEFTKGIVKTLLEKYQNKKWVIDAAALQVLDVAWIPKNSILTPNMHEYKNLFGEMNIAEASKSHNCTIVLKNVVDQIFSNGEGVLVNGGNVGMSKGGTGDTLAGLVLSLFAKNDAFLAASAASYINKKAGDELFKTKGAFFNADDLANKVPEILAEYTGSID